jgi:branched-chain amino acid transport system permease protein
MTLILGVMKIINLTHGQLMMAAMYIAFWMFELFHIDPYLSLFIAPPLLFGLGMLLQKFLINPVLKVESILPHNQVILTVGIGLVLQNLATIFFTSDYRSTRCPTLQRLVLKRPVEGHAGRDLPVAALDGLLLPVGPDHRAAVVLPGQDGHGQVHPGHGPGQGRGHAHGGQREQDAGHHLRAGSGPGGLRRLSFPAHLLPVPALGSQFTLIAFVITILGGLGSTIGAILGGLILGVFESMTATYVGMGWAPVGRFAIFVAALVFLPGGVASLLKSKKLTK